MRFARFRYLALATFSLVLIVAFVVFHLLNASLACPVVVSVRRLPWETSDTIEVRCVDEQRTLLLRRRGEACEAWRNGVERSAAFKRLHQRCVGVPRWLAKARDVSDVLEVDVGVTRAAAVVRALAAAATSGRWRRIVVVARAAADVDELALELPHLRAQLEWRRASVGAHAAASEVRVTTAVDARCEADAEGGDLARRVQQFGASSPLVRAAFVMVLPRLLANDSANDDDSRPAMRVVGRCDDTPQPPTSSASCGLYISHDLDPTLLAQNATQHRVFASTELFPTTPVTIVHCPYLAYFDGDVFRVRAAADASRLLQRVPWHAYARLMPLPYYTHDDAAAAAAATADALTTPLDRRPTLLSFVGCHLHADPTAPFRIRAQVVTALRRAAASDVRVSDPFDCEHRRAVSHIRCSPQADFLAAYRNASFCIVIGGDTAATARLHDTMRALCIPVLVDAATPLPFESTLPWMEMAVFWPDVFSDAGVARLVSYLRAMPDYVRRAKQRRIARHLPQLVDWRADGGVVGEVRRRVHSMARLGASERIERDAASVLLHDWRATLHRVRRLDAHFSTARFFLVNASIAERDVEDYIRGRIKED